MALIILGILFLLPVLPSRKPGIWAVLQTYPLGRPPDIPGGITAKCIVQIDAGDVGVKLLFGKVQNDVLYSGLHFINPLVEVRHLDIKTQNYTMSGIHDEGC